MQVFWDVMPCHWPYSSQHFEGSWCIGKVSLLRLHCLTLKINAVLAFETTLIQQQQQEQQQQHGGTTQNTYSSVRLLQES